MRILNYSSLEGQAMIKKIPLEWLHNKKVGTSKKDFKKMKQAVPCHQCIVLAICKSKPNIQCEILTEYMSLCLAYGANTLIAHKELTDLFPNSNSFNGTVLL